MPHDALPKWLQNRKIAKVSYRGATTDHAKTDMIPIRPRAQDPALFVGSPVRIQLMREMIARVSEEHL
jgi:hypothetical protein